MRFLLTALALFASFPALAQSGPVTPSGKLPPANPLPYDDPEATAVMVPVNALFAAFNAEDGAGVLAQTRPEGVLLVVNELPDGSRKIFTMGWAKLASVLKPGPNKNDERLGMPAIEIDGDIAMVWAPYVNYRNGKADHCGVDLMDMVRENGTWKVLNITSSHRNTGCLPQ
ncbi:MAG: hypothetical protein ABIR08_07345 [Sphingomonas sp.]